MLPLDATDAEYAQLLEADPRQPDAWRLRARIALQNLRDQDAVELLKQGLKHLPSNVALMTDLVNIHLLQRDPVSARPLLEKLRDAPDEYPDFTANYARLLWLEGEHEEALKYFEQALEHNPNDQKIATRLAQAYASLGQAEKALAFVQSRRDGGASARMLALLAACEFDVHGIEPALAAVRSGLKLQAEHPDLNYLYAVLLMLSGESDKAEAHVKQYQKTGDIHIRWTSFQFAYGKRGDAAFHGLGTNLMKSALAGAPASGLVLEFGVYQGLSLRQLAQLVDGPVYGFDSFEGLPEDWKPGEPAGSYSANGHLPRVPPQVELYPGWFQESIPEFVVKHKEKVRLAHIDCDLYSSTRTVLNEIYPLLLAGSILVFDEFLGYPGYEHHEFRAWNEFAKNFGVAYEFIGFTLMARKVALRISKIA